MSCPVGYILENKFPSLLPRNDNVEQETAVLSRRVHGPRVPFGEMILGRWKYQLQRIYMDEESLRPCG